MFIILDYLHHMHGVTIPAVSIVFGLLSGIIGFNFAVLLTAVVAVVATQIFLIVLSLTIDIIIILGGDEMGSNTNSICNWW